MLALTRWCIAHRRLVALSWVAIVIVTAVVAQSVGRSYTNNFQLPGTEAQRASDLLTREFPSLSGDSDPIVFHTTRGTIDQPQVRAAIVPMLARVAGLAHVATVVSPYDPRGAVQVSPDRRTAFAVVGYDKRANLLPAKIGQKLLDEVHSVRVPGLRIAAGGQVVQQAEGFSIGPATVVGVIAALVILLLTFGSLTAAGMPLVTAGLGLITGVSLIGLATHVLAMADVAPELAVMIGLGVGIDYALFIVTRFKESYDQTGDVHESVLAAMDTSGRAILLAGTTVVIALLGMFAVGVPFLYGMAVASVLAVLMTLAASLTVLPAMLSRFGGKLVRGRRARDGGPAPAAPDPARSAWRRWSVLVQSRPWPLAIVSTAVMLLFVAPATALRLDNSDSGNNPPKTSSRQAFDLLSQGFGPGFNGPLLIVAQLPGRGQVGGLPALTAATAAAHGVVTVTTPRLGPSGTVAVMQAYPSSSPQAYATSALVSQLRHRVLPPIERQTGLRVLVGGFTAGSIDFSNVLASKLPLFIAIVVVLSALLLLVIFRSVVIPLQAAAMNLLSIGGALGATVAVFQWGWLGGLIGVQAGPVEPWIPVLMFAVVFGLSMDYEVFLVSRVREEWVSGRPAGEAVADGIALTGRVISAAAAIMICVFLSFLIGDQRSIKEFGFGLAAAVFLDAVVVRCVMLPAVLELLGETTWRLPRWLDAGLSHINIEGGAARAIRDGAQAGPDASAPRIRTPA